MATKKKAPKKTGAKKKKIGANPSVIAGKKKYKKKKIATVSGTPSGDIVLGFIGGLGLSIAANKIIDGKDKLKAGAEVVVGGALAYFGHKKKKPLMLGAGLGIAAVGTVGALKEAGIITGMDELMNGIGFDGEIGEDTLLIEMKGIGDSLENSLVSGNNPAVIEGGEAPSMNERKSQPSVIMGS